MIYQALVGEDNRITAFLPANDDGSLGPEAIEIDIENDFNLSQIHHYIVLDGALVYDPLPEPEPKPDRVEQLEARVVELEQENTATMVALVEVYEMMLGGM